MITFLFYLFVLGASLVLEGTVRHLPLIGVRLDLVWLVVLYIGFHFPTFPGGIAVFLVGLTVESLGVPIHGILPLSYLAVTLFLRLTHNHLFFERGASQVIWIILLSLAQKGIEQLLLFWGNYSMAIDPWRLLASVLINGFVSLPLFSFLDRRGKISSTYAS